ncbi:hypothetical protein [Flavobacterium hydatis]|uniref:Uncharacterized protein n=1 Tax=Flavobacterium hydatis TaxID=991 RepID=A0A085ZYW0_FLAHY|nr:hypothetical protein [Flavobacterium hydatis]KFF09624.1 hypothetical protein IW20_23190 [Flavobacterium hydatis]OXA85762.1 hypothetical protein B0A62_24180 [Flavobacterium hydatis]
MKYIYKTQKIILATLFSLLSFCSVFAQTDNTKLKDGTVSTGATKAFPGALFELESNTKGMLTPRLTTAQRDGIASANRTDGLLIFNTTTGCFDYWSAIQSVWLSICGTPPPAVFGISADECLQIVGNGTYKQGVALTLGNYLTVPVTAIQPGTYTISATNSNGYYFTTSGTFPSAGSYVLNLPGTGTPNNGFTVGDPGDALTISLNGVPVSCVPHVFVEKANVDFVITCAGITSQGSYNIGIPLVVANKLLVEVNVTAPGFWSMSTNTVNGYSFSATGTFSAAGTQTIELRGTGTPLASGINNFNLSSNATTAGTGACSNVPVTVAPVAYTMDCTTATQNGVYMQNIPLIPANTISLPINVTATGQTTISTTTASGITFTTGLINLSVLGPQNVTLIGSGTPTASGPIAFTVTGTPGTVGTCSLNVTIASQPVTYVTNCGGITVAGTYAPGTAMDATNTMTVPVTVTYVGAYTISTNTVNGISFSATGTFSSIGLQNVVMTATGTPTSGGNFTFAITANSTNGSTPCNKAVPFVIRLMNVLGLGDGIYQPGTGGAYASRAVLASLANFGPTGTVQVDGIKIVNGGTNTGNTLKNLINTNKIDIIVLGYNYNTTDANTLNILADFVKNKKGVLIQAQENGNAGIATLVNSICGSTITAADVNRDNCTYINPLANIADPIFNGPFGNIQGLAIGGDNNNSYSMTLPANTISLATISGLPARVTTFRHNTLGYVYCGDGGLLTGTSSTNNSTTDYPAKITTTGLPLSKPYNGGTTVYNSIFYANAMAWAIGYVQDNINVGYVIP